MKSSAIFEYKPPTVFITPLALAKIQYIVDKVTMEVGWMGYVDRDEVTNDKGEVTEVRLTITDILIPSQEANFSTCELQEEGFDDILQDMLKEYGNEEGIERWNKLHYWGHSHHTMGVSPSSQDNSEILTFERRSWYLRSINNKRGEIKLDYYDFETNTKFEDLQWTVVSDQLDEAQKAELDSMLEARVQKKEYTVKTVSGARPWQRWQRDDYTSIGWDSDYEGFDDEYVWDQKLFCYVKRAKPGSQMQQSGVLQGIESNTASDYPAFDSVDVKHYASHKDVIKEAESETSAGLDQEEPWDFAGVTLPTETKE